MTAESFSLNDFRHGIEIMVDSVEGAGYCLAMTRIAVFPPIVADKELGVLRDAWAAGASLRYVLVDGVIIDTLCPA